MSLLEDLYLDLKTPSENRDPGRRRDNDSWIYDSFFTPRKKMTKSAKEWTFYSTADSKYVDSSWGGNFAVNSRPQWTPLADPRRIGLLTGRKSTFSNADPIRDIRNLGLGRMYSEHVDDAVQRIYFRFGVPQYNSLANFLDKMSSSEAVRIATTGSSFHFSKIVGEIMLWPFAVARAPIVGSLMVFSSITRFIFGSKLLVGSNQFYTLKSVQGQYWNTVQSLVNEFLTSTDVLRFEGRNTWADGALSYIVEPDEKSQKRQKALMEAKEAMNAGTEYTENNLKDVAKSMPDVFDEKYGMNVLRLLGKTARRSTRYVDSIPGSATINAAGELVSYAEQAMDAVRRRASGGVENVPVGAQYNDPEEYANVHAHDLLNSASKSAYYSKEENAAGGTVKPPQDQSTLDGFLGMFSSKETGASDVLDAKKQAALSKDPRVEITSGESPDYQNKGLWDSIVTSMDNSLKYGAEFVAFDVSYNGQVEESVTNNVQPSPLGEMMRGIAGSSRTFRNMTANGNLGDGIIANLVEGAASIVGGLATGAANLVTFGFADNLLDLLQGAQVDMPQFWESSNMTLPTASYTMQLRPSGSDMMSQLKGIYLPLFCIIAGAFPQGVGESAHVHPFYCQLFDKGRISRDCAMITRISITRGVSNLGFDNKWRALAIDVNIEVTDLAPILSVPALPGLLVPGHPMTNYIWTLSSVELDSKINGLVRMTKNLERLARGMNSFFDVTNRVNDFAQSVKGGPLRFILTPRHALGIPDESYSDGLDPRL